MRLHFFKSAVMENSKMGYSFVSLHFPRRLLYLNIIFDGIHRKRSKPSEHLKILCPTLLS